MKRSASATKILTGRSCLAASIFADFQRSLSIDSITFFTCSLLGMILCYTIFMSKSTLSETDFQNTVIELAELHQWRIYHVAKVKGQLRSKTSIGFPDLVLVRSGQLIFAELKVGKNNPTEDQRRWLGELRKCLPDVYLWRPCDWREIEKILL